MVNENGTNFVNFSNHPSSKWSQEQIEAAKSMAPDGELNDVAFPFVPPSADENEIKDIAQKYIAEILNKNPAAVMCMGEFGVCYHVISALKNTGIKVVYSCTERRSEERTTDSGTEKVSVFQFVRFREY